MLVAALGGLLLLTLLVAAAVLIPGISGLTGRGPRDLGVRYDGRDLASALEKLSVPAGGSSLDAVLTDAEVTALVNDRAASEGLPLRQVQIRSLEGDRFELSAMVRLGGRNVPAYASGRAGIIRGGLEPIAIDHLQVVGLPVPSPIRERVEGSVTEQIRRRLARWGGFALQSVQLTKGGARVRGTSTGPA